MKFVTDLKAFYKEDGFATESQYQEAYRREQQSWIDENVYVEVPRSNVPKKTVILFHLMWSTAGKSRIL